MRGFHDAGPSRSSRTVGLAPSIEHQTKVLVTLLRPSLGVARSRTIAPHMLAKFGSLPQVLAAPSTRLEEVPGIGHHTARTIGAIHEAAKLLAQMRIDTNSPVLSCWSELISYCHVAMAFETIEQVRILFLDKRNRLIANEVIQTGTVDYTPVYPREVIKRALELSATALILVHNHPSGDPTPSSADVRMTKEIADIAKPLGIKLHDHLVIGKAGHASVKSLFGGDYDGHKIAEKTENDRER